MAAEFLTFFCLPKVIWWALVTAIGFSLKWGPWISFVAKCTTLESRMQKYVVNIYAALKKKNESVLLFFCVWQNPKRSQYSTDRMNAVLCSHPVKIIRPVSYIRENKLFFSPYGVESSICRHASICRCVYEPHISITECGRPLLCARWSPSTEM